MTEEGVFRGREGRGEVTSLDIVELHPCFLNYWRTSYGYAIFSLNTAGWNTKLITTSIILDSTPRRNWYPGNRINMTSLGTRTGDSVCAFGFPASSMGFVLPSFVSLVTATQSDLTPVLYFGKWNYQQMGVFFSLSPKCIQQMPERNIFHAWDLIRYQSNTNFMVPCLLGSVCSPVFQGSCNRLGACALLMNILKSYLLKGWWCQGGR